MCKENHLSISFHLSCSKSASSSYTQGEEEIKQLSIPSS